MDNLFVESSDEILKVMVDKFQADSGEVLQDADARKMMLRATTLGIILLGSKLNSAARNRFLKYCDEETLDLFADDKGISKRYQAKKALTTIRFSRIITTGVQAIPFGTRISNGQLIFSTVETKSFAIGQSELLITAECELDGSVGNGYGIGNFSILVDTIPYISAVCNTTVTNGGSDMEGVEAYRERIRIAPETYSCAGTRGAYEFWAKSAESSISDVNAFMDSPGVVGITCLIENGVIPSDEILERIRIVVASDDVRALTDNIITKKPTQISYSNDFTYFIPRSLDKFSKEIQAKVTVECAKWEYENRNKLGVDINPQELDRRVMNLGAIRVERRNPAYTKLDKTKIAICTISTPVFGGIEDD